MFIPKPTPQQYAWQNLEFGMFCHFGLNTFNDKEWSDGTLDPASFDPGDLQTGQWVKAAKEAGCRYLVFTAKHHDGFCLWPSQYADYSVKRSPWCSGKGDVVCEVSKACEREGIKLGLYLSPWDRHEPSYKNPPAYNVYYKNQLTELLTNYGEIVEVWFDGAGSEGYPYDFPGICEIVHKYQPNAMILNMGEATIRWAGNENGVASYPCWNVVEYPVKKNPVSGFWTYKKDDYPRWMPAECDVPIRKNWFWHTDDAHTLKSLNKLLDIYYRSIGHGANLLLNVGPDRSGKLPDQDIARLKELRAEIDRRIGQSLVTIKNSGAETKIKLSKPSWVDHAVSMETIEEGERIRQYQIEALTKGKWIKVCEGTAIGHKKIDRFKPVLASQIRLKVTSSVEETKIRSLSIYYTGK